jgi:hypothetical protein
LLKKWDELLDIYSKILMREDCDVDKIARVLGDFGIR